MTEHYKEVTQEELEKIEQYRLLYEITNPYPEKEKTSFWKELGLEASALIASAVGSITLSAIRTSTIFMLTEALLIAAFDKENIIPDSITSGFPLASMVVSLVAFEGFISAHGFIKGKESERISISDIALWLCFGVTIVAGLSASFGLLGLEADNIIFQGVVWILAVLTAVGAPVVAYFGSFNLGVITNKWLRIKNDAEERFLEAVRSWNSSFQSSFSGKRSQKLYGERTVKRTNVANERQETFTNRSQRTFAGNEQKERIIEILDSSFSGNGRELLGTSDVAKILAADRNGGDDITGYENLKGYVHKVRKEWMLENGL